MFGINIVGTGIYRPGLTVTNEDMAKIVDTNDECISTRTGIRERRMSNGEPTWYMGTHAAQQAIDEAGIDPKDIAYVICATITSDFHTPSTACIIQREIGAVNAACFDLNAACSGFIYALDTAKRFLQTEDTAKYILVVSSENLSKIINFEDRSSCILFADGAAAFLVERSEKLYGSWLGADGQGAKYIYARADAPSNPFMTEPRFHVADETDESITHKQLVQDGKEVYKFATKALPTAAVNAAERAGIAVTDIDVFVPHQANLRIIETAAKNLGVSMDKLVLNIDKRGNTSSASIPSAFHDGVCSGQIKRGDKVCLVGFGAGLTLGSAIIEY